MAYRKRVIAWGPGNGTGKHDHKIISTAEPVSMGRAARRKLERLERKASRNPPICETVASKFCE